MEKSLEKSPPSFTHKNSTPESRLLEIRREFDVPVAKLFDAFRSSEALKIWWWPTGLHADKIQWDFREGGAYFINMKGPRRGGGGGGMVGHFGEIVANDRIVMSDQFSDANGKVISAREAGMSGDWPEYVYITLEFEASGSGSSRLHLSQEGIPTPLQAECRQGWDESFDKLEKYLGERRQ